MKKVSKKKTKDFQTESAKNPKPDMSEHSSIDSSYFDDYIRILDGYNPSDLVGIKGLEIFERMQKDEQVKAALGTKNYAVLSTGWDIKPAEKISQSVAEQHAEFIKMNFTDWMKGSFADILKKFLTFIPYGFMIAEQNYRHDGEFILLDNIKVRAPHTFKIYPDEHGNITNKSIIQMQVGKEVVMNNKNNKFILHSFNDTFGNPYGCSDLEAAHRSWFIKDKLIKFEAIFLEKFGTPSIIAKTDTTKKTTRDEIMKMLQRLRNASVGLLPKEVEYDIVNAITAGSSGGGDHYRKAIQGCDDSISKAILMPNQLGYNTTEAGSNAKSKTHFEVFLWCVDSIRQNDIEESIINEQVIRPLIDFNFGPQEAYSKFKFNPLTEEDKIGIHELWIKAVVSGAVKPTIKDEAHIRQDLEFPEREEGDELLNPDIEPEDEDDFIEDDEGTQNLQKKTKLKELKFANNDFPVTDNMKKTNFKMINSVINKEEELLYNDIDTIIEKISIDTIDRIDNKNIVGKRKYDEIDKFQLRHVGELKLAYKRAFSRIYAESIKIWKSEQAKGEFQNTSEIPPAEYFTWLNSQSFMEAGKLADGYKIMVRQTLLQSITDGWSEKKTFTVLNQKFARLKLVGAEYNPVFTENRIRVGVIRTNLNAAFNKGRYLQNTNLASKSKNPIYRLFSEVLSGQDKNSHPFSKVIHGKYVLSNSDLSQRLQYPFHFGERGIEVTVNGAIETVPEDKILTSMPDLSSYNGLLIS